eukprot:m51a1_g12404 putative telomerase cajal body protein 1 (388) ;mRNA; f:693236-694723
MAAQQQRRMKLALAGAQMQALYFADESPDGTCLMTASEDNVLRIFELPRAAYESSDATAVQAGPTRLASVLRAAEGETIYDNRCTSRDHPVHLWDAFTARLRASYRAHDAVDNVMAALSLCFSPSGSALYCGYPSELRAFDISRPGRQHVLRAETCKRGRGQRMQLVSCVCASASGSAIAAGSYSGSVAVFSASDLSRVAELGSPAHAPGVTQVAWVGDEHVLTGARRDGAIRKWDVRNTSRHVCEYRRQVATNQRVSFCVSPCAGFLLSGSADGCLLVWDLRDESASPQPVASVPGHGDAVNGVSCHPTLPLVASSTGQRHLGPPEAPRGAGEAEEDEDDMEDDQQQPRPQEQAQSKVWVFKCAHVWEDVPTPTTVENSKDATQPN